MALALEFKQRLRPIPDAPEREVRARRSPVLWLGALGWLAAAALGLAVDRGYVPLHEWLEPDVTAEETEEEVASLTETSEPDMPGRAPEPQATPAETAETTVAMESASASVPLLGFEPVGASPRASAEPVNSGAPTRSARAKHADRNATEQLARLTPASQATTAMSPSRSTRETASTMPAESETAPTISEYDRPATSTTNAGSLPQPVALQTGSCEEAIRNLHQQIVMGEGRAAPDLTEAQFASVLENGSWFSHCGVPAAVRVDVCVAVRAGRAVGVTVETAPRRKDLERCVATAARRLAFPFHSELDVTRTTFAPTP